MAGEEYSFNSIRKALYIQGSTDRTSSFGIVSGGQYNSTLPTLSDGAFTHFQTDNRGRLLVDMDGVTFTGDVNVDAFTLSDGSTPVDAMVYTNGEDLSAVSELWQGIGGYDSMNDRFRAMLLDSEGKTVIGKSYAIPDGIGSSGALISTPTGSVNDAPLVVMPLMYNGADWDRLTGDKTDGLLVNLGSNNDITGDVTSNSQNIATEDTLASIETEVTTELEPHYNPDADETPVELKASSGKLHYVHVYNPNAYDVRLQLFNIAAASVVLGTTPIRVPLRIPAQGYGWIDLNTKCVGFDTAMSYAITKTDNTSALDTDAEITIFYR